jgi:hypothetical protein
LLYVRSLTAEALLLNMTEIDYNRKVFRSLETAFSFSFLLFLT